MDTILFSHPVCLEHETPPGHPERVDRLKTVLAVMEKEDFMYLHREVAPLATREQILKAHDEAYVAELEARLPKTDAEVIQLDPDTYLGWKSLEAAYSASGAITAAIDAVMEGRAKNAFCAVRPPGHHATRNQAMGFCLFNQIAVGAYHARDAHGLGRVAIVDFDVHHGNGTQDIFYNEPDVFYGSTHQFPCYPGTGAPEETGIAGNIVNGILSPGSGSTEFRRVCDERILPALDAFAPDFILLSAGFDAHHRDPLANLRLNEADFSWITREVMALADRHCEGRVVSGLEGGYDLIGLGESVAAHVRALMGI